MKPLIKKTSGITLVVLGIFGLFLPFLQGILMIVAGLTILGDKRIVNLIKKGKEYFRKRKSSQ
ncbi:MAG: PGPGW domain-containing protein [Candidatus Cloacimonadota bacterium]|nr:PGPGW domain-containing protein [Candidatus Cloacimonadota bacterium]